MKTKNLKKILILIVLLFAIILLGSTKVEARTTCSADDAINWVNSKLGQAIDVDGAYGAQCVDLIMAYYQYLGGYRVSGNGADYTWNEVPSDWTRLQGVQPQKGDILVYTGNTYGHVAIYESDWCTYHQNFNSNQTVQKITQYKYNGLSNPYWGVIRPDFKNGPKITYLGMDTPTATTNTMTAMAWLSDNTNVSSVQMRIWRSGYEADTGTTKNATYNSAGGFWQVKFTESDIKKGTSGVVCVEAWAYSKSNTKSSSVAIYDFAFAGKVTGLGSFKARIVPKENTNYCLGISGTNDGDDVKLKSKNLSDKSQIWGFTELSDGSFRIYNDSTKKYLSLEGGDSVDKDGGIFELATFNSTRRDQKYMLQTYNGGYRIVPINTGGVRALDIKDGTMQDNQPILEWKTVNSANKAQTWFIQIIPTDISLSKTNVDIIVGKMDKLFVKTTPAGAGSPDYRIWKSSNPSVATVNSIGYITAKSEGTAIITCTTTDGSNLSASCKVNVVRANGLTKVNGTWYYLNNGNPDTNYTGLVQYNGSWFYVQKGELKWGVKTLVKYNGTWYYVNNSTVDWNYTGLVKYNGSWYYVQKGTLKWGEETLVKYNGTWFYVKNSTVDWNYTGLVKYNGSWFYVQKGQLNWGVKTLTQYYKTWYYVNNSKLDWNYTGLCEYNGKWYYIQKGVLKWGYNGKVVYNGKTYTVKNSTVV